MGIENQSPQFRLFRRFRWRNAFDNRIQYLHEDREGTIWVGTFSGGLARYDAGDDILTVWDSTQMPHKSKRVLVETLGLTEERVRVIAPDVGGGFGPKNPFYPEELAIPAATLALGRPIKWIEDRRESFTATNHEREQDWDVEAAVDGVGKLLAIRGHLRHDHGVEAHDH